MNNDITEAIKLIESIYKDRFYYISYDHYSSDNKCWVVYIDTSFFGSKKAYGPTPLIAAQAALAHP